jgi:hypothetical protein
MRKKWLPKLKSKLKHPNIISEDDQTWQHKTHNATSENNSNIYI